MRLELDALPAEALPGGVERRRVVGERLELVHYTYPPGATFPEHHHEAEQWTLVLEGRLAFVFAVGEVELGEGDSVLIASGRSHGAYVPAEAGRTRTVNVFSPVRERLPGG